MLTFVLFLLSYGNYGFEVVNADSSGPTCYSNFDYELRLFETVADTKHDQKTLTNTVVNLQDLVEKLEAKVATQDSVNNLQDIVEKLEANVATLDTVNKLQDLVEKLKAKADAQEQLIQDQAVSYNESLQGKESASTYVRWGRTSCPTNGTSLIYQGYAGGSYYSHTGSGADLQCLPEEPTWGDHLDGVQGTKGFMYGAEYEPSSLHFDSLAQQDVPCAVCLTTRSTSIMIPARTSCYPGWTLEYEGNLASEHYKYQKSQYTCIDKEAESAPGSSKTNSNGALFHAVEGRCGALPCPPYVEGRELACVIQSV